MMVNVEPSLEGMSLRKGLDLPASLNVAHTPTSTVDAIRHVSGSYLKSAFPQCGRRVEQGEIKKGWSISPIRARCGSTQLENEEARCPHHSMRSALRLSSSRAFMTSTLGGIGNLLAGHKGNILETKFYPCGMQRRCRKFCHLQATFIVRSMLDGATTMLSLHIDGKGL